MPNLVRRAIKITLKGPVLASAHTATAAEPDGLPYLPGAMLWGVLAAQAYGTAGAKHQAIYDNLYAGGLLIGDALPLVNAVLGLPVPMSLHQKKGATADWQDWSIAPRAAGFSQAKHWAVGPGVSQVDVKLETTQRTAINPDTGTAADGQFFGFQAICAGQSFVSVIEGPDAATVDVAVTSLCGDRFLGRSRNAEYGRVWIETADLPGLPAITGTDAHFVWCLSDIAAHDDFGQPTDRPGDAFFGAAIDWRHSFVRHRRFAPYNSTWKSRMPERLVIARGSVIKLKTPVRPGLCRVGFHQEQGLGLVLASAEPPLEMLKGWVGETTTEPGGPEQAVTVANVPETPLTKWLKARKAELTIREKDAVLSRDAWQVTWEQRYKDAASIAGTRVGPTPTQWGALADSDNPGEFLNNVGHQDQSRAESTKWQAKFGSEAADTFDIAAKAFLDENNDRALRKVATELRRQLKIERWFDGQ